LIKQFHQKARKNNQKSVCIDLLPVTIPSINEVKYVSLIHKGSDITALQVQ